MSQFLDSSSLSSRTFYDTIQLDYSNREYFDGKSADIFHNGHELELNLSFLLTKK